MMDLLMVVYPTALAGLGPARWLWGTCEVVRNVGKRFAIPTLYVGPRLRVGDADLAPDVAIERAATVGDRYANVQAALRRAVASPRARRIGMVSVGYTAHTSWAAQRLASPGTSIDLMILDSSPPDTDEKNSEVGADGLPVTRFHWEAYAPVAHVRQYFYLCSTYRYGHAAVAARMPDHMPVFVGRHPYPREYEEFIQRTKPVRRSETTTISVVCSGDYWDGSAVDEWMTRPQYDSMMRGTINLMRGIEVAADAVGPITVPIDACGARMLAEIGYRSTPRVILDPFSPLPHPEHLAMLKGSDLLIVRGGNQTNSVAAATLMQIPFVFWDVPADRYMQTGETNAEAIAQGLMRGVDFDTPPSLIVKAIKEELANGTSRCERRLKEFFETPTLEDTLIRTFGLD